MKKVMMLIMLVAVSNYGIINAQLNKTFITDKSSWHKIGETTINFLAEKYEILVLKADKLGYIKFKVSNAPIVLVDLEVFFENGRKRRIDVNSLVKEPGESWVIILNPGERNIQKVAFVYRTIPNHKDEKAQVELWGLKNVI
jgi:hypothetical protein